MKLAVSAALAAALCAATSLSAFAQSTKATIDVDASSKVETCDPGSPNCKADLRKDKSVSGETTGSVRSDERSAADEAQDDISNRDCPPGLAKKEVNPSQGRDTTDC
ncbi:hypothetical protein AU381_18540 [Sinorhizobium glycinis]|uniref:Secreted protein n=1 Tax=Sinorhizobium glycinis TaxID=1472378 RepID=A0A178XMM9_9HYPH|nr:hypothetical protein [Sinorhizobium glycinis]OAP36501.1 hypothetical protein AU381_18540 [Sinorhizobium glycinis]